MKKALKFIAIIICFISFLCAFGKGRTFVCKQIISLTNIMLADYDINFKGLNSIKINSLAIEYLDIHYKNNKFLEIEKLDITYDKEFIISISKLAWFDNKTQTDFDFYKDLQDALINIDNVYNWITIKIDEINFYKNEILENIGNLNFQEKKSNNKYLKIALKAINNNFTFRAESNFHQDNNLIVNPIINITQNGTNYRLTSEFIINASQKKLTINDLNFYHMQNLLLNANASVSGQDLQIKLKTNNFQSSTFIPYDIRQYIEDFTCNGTVNIAINNNKYFIDGKLVLDYKNDQLVINIDDKSIKDHYLVNFDVNKQNAGKLIISPTDDSNNLLADLNIENKLLKIITNGKYSDFKNAHIKAKSNFNLKQKKLVNADLVFAAKYIKYFDIELYNLELNSKYKDKIFTVSKLNFTDKNSALVEARGYSKIETKITHDYKILSNGFKFKYEDIFDGMLISDVNLTGINNKFNIEGEVKLKQSKLFIDNTAKSEDIKVIKIEEKNKDENFSDINLNLIIKIIDDLVVTGKNLKASLIGNLNIKGDSNSPDFNSNISVKSGKYEFLGKNFTISDSKIISSGKEIYLLLKAELKQNEYLYNLNLTGKIGDIFTVKLTSFPPLPDDQIFTQLIFGKDPQSLSPYEIFLLGKHLAELSGISNNNLTILDDIKDKLGIENIEIKNSEDNSINFHIEKKISKDINLIVDRDTNKEKNRYILEKKILKSDLSIFIGTDEKQNTSFGVMYNHKYY